MSLDVGGRYVLSMMSTAAAEEDRFDVDVMFWCRMNDHNDKVSFHHDHGGDIVIVGWSNESSQRKKISSIPNQHMSNTSVNIKNLIGNILGLDEVTHDSWDILSSLPDVGLYLVHYKPDADLSRFGNLRGTVVDINARCIVCQSFGYTPTAVADQIVPDENGIVTIRDTSGLEHVMNVKNTGFKCGFEGTIIRIFLHDGKVYRATHRRINPINSRWGDSITFNAMYDQLNGPADQVMFDLTAGRYSPYVHIFLMVHPDILACSKQEIGTGYMVYLGVKQTYSTEPEESPYRQEGNADDVTDDLRPFSGPIDPAIRLPNVVTVIPTTIDKPFLLDLFDLTIDQANDQLHFGFYEPFDITDSVGEQDFDPRLGCGEFVMAYRYDEIGHLIGLLRITSPAYQWRSDVHDHNPNLLHRLYQLLNASYIRADTPSGLQDFKAKFPIIFPFQPDSVAEKIRANPITIWRQPPVDSSAISSKDERLYNVWVCLMMAVPLHRQKDVALLYGQIISDRGNLIEWLRSLYSSERYLANEPKFMTRAIDMVSLAMKFAQQKTNSGQNRDKYGKLLSIDMMVADNLRNLVSKEKGDSLYRLVKAMKDERCERKERTKPIIPIV
jgi:hypothetical protein